MTALGSCRWFHFAIAIVSAILFTVFLIYDLQLLMGGRGREFDPDMYVIAALNIYLDVIQIFLNVLQIIGILGSD
jgi:protein lifeguard